MLDNLTDLYDKKCVCRHCDTTFYTKRVRRGSQPILKRDADFCTYYKTQKLNPIVYTVHVCPNCGFAFTDQFARKLLPATKKLIQEQITTKWTPKDFGGVRNFTTALASYKLAIYAAELTGEAHSVKAGLYLRLAWLYRYQGIREEEIRFLKLAVHEYEQSYIHSDYITGDKEMSEVRILYLIGELMRRIGQFDKAILYFSKALEFRNRTIETGILAMAHEQWQLAREEYKQQRGMIS